MNHQIRDIKWAVDVAQLAEWSPPTTVIWGSNPNITKIVKGTNVSVNCLLEKKTRIKKFLPGQALFMFLIYLLVYVFVLNG